MPNYQHKHLNLQNFNLSIILIPCFRSNDVAERALLMNGVMLKDIMEVSSGSGSGPCFLIQKTIAKQLSFKELLGQGEFSGNSIWLAEWNGSKVAVKVFPTSNECSWDREREIYNTVLLRHPNILGYISSDIRGM